MFTEIIISILTIFVVGAASVYAYYEMTQIHDQAKVLAEGADTITSKVNDVFSNVENKQDERINVYKKEVTRISDTINSYDINSIISENNRAKIKINELRQRFDKISYKINSGLPAIDNMVKSNKDTMEMMILADTRLKQSIKIMSHPSVNNINKDLLELEQKFKDVPSLNTNVINGIVKDVNITRLGESYTTKVPKMKDDAKTVFKTSEEIKKKYDQTVPSHVDKITRLNNNVINLKNSLEIMGDNLKTYKQDYTNDATYINNLTVKLGTLDENNCTKLKTDVDQLSSTYNVNIQKLDDGIDEYNAMSNLTSRYATKTEVSSVINNLVDINTFTSKYANKQKTQQDTNAALVKSVDILKLDDQCASIAEYNALETKYMSTIPLVQQSFSVIPSLISSATSWNAANMSDLQKLQVNLNDAKQRNKTFNTNVQVSDRLCIGNFCLTKDVVQKWKDTKRSKKS
jgi:hypothetical protein